MSTWIDVCATDEIDEEDVIRFDHGARSFAVYKSPTGDFLPLMGFAPMRKCIWLMGW